MNIREAMPADAEAMSVVLIASITELCGDDHRGDPTAIAAWTANKSPKEIARWFANPANRLFVAEDSGGVIAVGGFQDSGEIILNYVAPAARFRGTSKAVLAHLEAAMRADGLTTVRLESTGTAHGFYLGAGWKDAGEATQKVCGVRCLAMTKELA